MTLEDAVRESKVVIVSTPVDSLTTLLPRVLDMASGDTVVLDVGSTKMPVLQAAEWSIPRVAGLSPPTRWQAPNIRGILEAAVSGLFSGKCCVFSDIEKSDPDAVGVCRQLYSSLGMRLSYLNGPAHDLHVAYVSHISHIASFALALTVLEKEREEQRIFELASGGFSSTVNASPRAARKRGYPSSDRTADNVLDVLDEFINTVSRFRTLLIKKDFEPLKHSSGTPAIYIIEPGQPL